MPNVRFYRNNELMHYGVKGMKWGVRRYQPYRRGSRSPGAVERIEPKYRLKKYTSPDRERFKTYLKNDVLRTVASVTGLGMIWNVYAIASNTNMISKSIDKRNYFNIEGEPEKLSKLKKKSQPTTIEQDVKKCNPRFGEQKGKINNCVCCTVTMEMRRRGYDVIARSSAKGFTDSQWKEWFQNPKLQKPNLVKRKGESRKAFVNRGYDTMCQMIEKHGEGSRGYIGTTYEGVFSGHAMYWEVSSGRVKFYDGQNGSMKNDKVFALSDPNGYSIVRLDNLKLKPEVTKMCRSNDATAKGKR